MRVVVGLSGGVDSSVAAYLLKKQGHEVIGLFMRNWDDASVTLEDECLWIEDSTDAMMVAEKLEIPFQVIDLSSIYKEKIVDYMFKEYEMGRTPNPDVLCNREVKFDVFLEAALGLGADFVATGHYCRKETIEKEGKTIHQLLAGKDTNKDQSYFLCQLNQYQLSKAIFPIGALTKPEVREIAKTQALITADKKDSQGLCFIGKVSLPEFLQQQLKAKKGEIVEIAADATIYQKEPISFTDNLEELAYLAKKTTYQKQDGDVIGTHQGAHYYTIGQRKGLGVGGKIEPLFVLDTDVKENIIYVGQGKNHPGLYRKALFISNEEIHWVREDLRLAIGEEIQASVRIRYRQALQNAKLIKTADGLYISFQTAQSAIASGQFAAWYIGDELIGSGVIY